MNVYEYVFRDNEGNDVVLSEFKDKNILIVNTASKCGFTKQYADLQEISTNDNIKVIAFPCNQFGQQEPGSNEEIKEFCSTTYGVDFQIAEKIDVNGELEHPLYTHLKAVAKNGQDIGWNFEKFLIKPDESISYFPSDFSPIDIAKLV
jgi:glutathione peroxidase